MMKAVECRETPSSCVGQRIVELALEMLNEGVLLGINVFSGNIELYHYRRIVTSKWRLWQAHHHRGDSFASMMVSRTRVAALFVPSSHSAISWV